MEGTDVYRKSYNHMVSILKANTTDIITIDYKQFDAVTAGEVRNAIDKVLMKRKREIGPVVFVVK